MRSLSLQMERLFFAAKFQDDSDGLFFFFFFLLFQKCFIVSISLGEEKRGSADKMKSCACLAMNFVWCLLAKGFRPGILFYHPQRPCHKANVTHIG